MTLGILLLSTFALFIQEAPPSLPTVTGPMRNTFVVAAETVIDNAYAVNLKSEDAVYDAQLAHLKSSKDNLAALASDVREKDIADSANNMLFLVSACHIQAKNGSDTAKCESQLARARNNIMQAINKHKTGNTWTDGPPS